MKQILYAIALILLISCAAKTGQVDKSGMMEGKTMDMSEAMKVGTPVKCTVVQQNQTITIYMKGSMMRMNTMPADAHAIYTEDTIYTWMGQQGNMMKMADMKKLAEQMGQQFKPKTQEEIVDAAKEKGITCTAEQVPQDTFTPPSDVAFQDMTQIMRQMAEASKSQK